MADFVGLLKRAIDAQSNVTSELRLRIYDRARETVKKKLSSSNVSAELIELQLRVIEKAINEVEEFYRGAENAPLVQYASTEFQKNSFPEKEAFLKPEPSTAAVEIYETNGDDRQSQEASSGAMFTLPQNINSKEKFRKIPTVSSINGFSFNGNDSTTFLPVLEALSMEADRDEKALESEKLLSPQLDLAQDQTETVCNDEGYIFLEKDMPDRLIQDIMSEPLPISDMASDPIIDDEKVYQSAPDFLIANEDSTQETAQFYRGENTISNHVLEEPIISSIGLPVDTGKRAIKAVAQKPAFVPEAFPALKTVAAQKSLRVTQNVLAEASPAVADRLPEYVKPKERLPKRPQRVVSITPTGSERHKSLSNEKSDDFPLVADIFSQAVIREKKRFSRNQLLAGSGIIVAVLCIIVAIVWFLIGFLQQEEQVSVNHSQVEPVAKITNRLMQDGQETDPGPIEGHGVLDSGISQTITSGPISEIAEAVFYESGTSLLPEILEKGSVRWSLLREKTKKGREEMAIRGDVTIPGKDMMLRMIIRRNTNLSISAAYLIELIFNIPENFEGGAVDRVSQLLFKTSEQSIGQELYGTVPFRIDDNFFILAIDAPEPFLSRNLNIMRQLSWIKLNIAYKNGRIGEFSLAKGEEGDAIFKQVLDEKIE
ncbi:MAG: hypothetical protein JSC189_001313 [Candidatus Tokpelaia sp. JSC189]|nr:MAG: hypothetical protein JSC189_001313 [Candidatus Tokpelaia sp. JSC189]